MNVFYIIKPLIPRRLQLFLRGLIVRLRRKNVVQFWPICPDVSLPQIDIVWPNRKRFAFVITHDIESEKGVKNCRKLSEIDIEMGFRSSFNFVPEKYKIDFQIFDYLRKNGFEIGVHGLKHDGKLYSSFEVFQKRANIINQYLKKWGAVGFRSPAMHHNLEWIHLLDIEYDSSTFDTDPFEPQPDGINSIFPLWIANKFNHGYVELPYTLPQDFSLFILLKEKNIDNWIRKLDWIAEKGGMALINVHPDYINFQSRRSSYDEYPVKYYKDLLLYINENYSGQFWSPLPKELSTFYKSKIISIEGN